MEKFIYDLKPRGSFELHKLNYRHVLIQFSVLDDYSLLLRRSICYIHGLPMRVFKYTPGFNLKNETSIAPVWVNVPGVPPYMYNREAIFFLASSIGNPLEFDDFTADRKKISVARFCVEIDLLKPRVEQIPVMTGYDDIEMISLPGNYENVPKFCTFCSHLGHSVENCYMNGNAKKPDFPPPPQRIPKPTAPPKEKQVWRRVEKRKNVVVENMDIPITSGTKSTENPSFSQAIVRTTADNISEGDFEHYNPFELLKSGVQEDIEAAHIQPDVASKHVPKSSKKGRKNTSNTKQPMSPDPIDTIADDQAADLDDMEALSMSKKNQHVSPSKKNRNQASSSRTAKGAALSTPSLSPSATSVAKDVPLNHGVHGREGSGLSAGTDPITPTSAALFCEHYVTKVRPTADQNLAGTPPFNHLAMIPYEPVSLATSIRPADHATQGSITDEPSASW
ncbi:PREDICTED: uncharacterized protein LOC105961601 [Erythranthe guttata]|uniref:uncharacterized protein LOC105961601 n=1 Tax=Erythranthe guttata TaxID=4155 RepID=UPI00064DAC10|nr:PREDICTED: uncharacterized protein LOC105961601 [Erythranthe guttata]|eukprot:XP_012841289.1 PREDICTED: uncharacterized protein LOC105961601 [Erythranthe guttata]